MRRVKVHAAGKGYGKTLCGHGSYIASKPEFVDCPRCLAIIRERKHRLESAAPELLGALENLIGKGISQITYEDWDAARAAIAKARG